MENPLKSIVTAQKAGKPLGIYSVCSANPDVIEAALRRGKDTDSCVLIESTANQCDQYGGYTGMTPAQFKDFVEGIADQIGFDKTRLFLGGDHLGPLTFAKWPEEKAMDEAETLVREYAKAGFQKIHIDTSMKVADDDENERLSDETIARRGARLARAAWEEAEKREGAMMPVFIIGSEVPIPGGAVDLNAGMQVTRPEDFKATYETFRQAFEKEGLQDAWNQVIGIVVQPGIEEKDAGCVDYVPENAAKLMASIKEMPNLVFEGHSSDYQTRDNLRRLVEDGVAILKVGPGLTFAAREGLYALSFIEDELYPEGASNFVQVLDEAMLEDDKYWGKYYPGDADESRFRRKWSFSDRSRYYIPTEKVQAARQKLLDNLDKSGVPLSLLSQYMPNQYKKVREGKLENTPKELLLDKIGETMDDYLYATRQEQLDI